MSIAIRTVAPIVEQPCNATREAIILQRFRELANLSGIRPSIVSVNPDAADAAALASDVLAIERRMVPLLQDLADYAAETLAIDREYLQDEVNIIIDALSNMRGL